ncbi:MAG: diadenylate cyclase CdaA [Phycisphaerales bacterium]|nr:diadenylate cyclase CdaA [Phycisphaerales bacterium]MCI0630957.1 diadenylate cyclase CdaA [Phycisphaerales bacterium]MCI0674320.1 diadenylate cyclase CdaA [Phycisphaerales bacterium]
MFSNPIQLIRGQELLQVVIEMAVIWVCVFAAFRFLRGTRGAGIFKGFAILFILLTLVIRVLGQGHTAFERLNFIYDQFLGLLAIAVIVIFQPELRQAMIRLSHARQFRGYRSHIREVIGAVSEAVEFLSKNQFGALIAIERSIKLGGLVEAGQALDARVSSRLLESIFWPNSPLHDLGVVIRDNRIVAAGVQFPLAEEGVLPARTGSRHRAAVGLTMETDCLVVIVSEETGAISIAEQGRLSYDVPRELLGDMLAERFSAPPPPPPTPGEQEENEAAVEEDDRANRQNAA